MSTEIFMTLLFMCSILTGLITEALKELTTGKANAVAGIIAVILGIAVYVSYIAVQHITVTLSIVIAGCALCLLSWLCAMLGYDKVIQSLKQLKR